MDPSIKRLNKNKQIEEIGQLRYLVSYAYIKILERFKMLKNRDHHFYDFLR